MGCATSALVVAPRDTPAMEKVNAADPEEFPWKRERRSSTSSTIVSNEALDSEATRLGQLSKRYGHPAYYKVDGYDVGLRYRVNGTMQSFFVACSRKTGEKVTIKEYHRMFYPAEDTSIAAELQILQRINHSGVPRARELFVTDASVFLVTNYLDQQRLTHHIQQLSVADCRVIFHELAQILKHAHEKRIMLRNLTPNNIVLAKTKRDQNPNAPAWDVKIADLTFAIDVSQAGQASNALSNHALFDWKMVPYLAPESVLSRPFVGVAADWWSLGVLLYHMLSRGSLPFDHPIDHVLVRNITTAHFDYHDEIWEEDDEEEEEEEEQSPSSHPSRSPFSPAKATTVNAEDSHGREDAKTVIEGLLRVSVKDRWGWKELVQNGWMMGEK